MTRFDQYNIIVITTFTHISTQCTGLPADGQNLSLLLYSLYVFLHVLELILTKLGGCY